MKKITSLLLVSLLLLIPGNIIAEGRKFGFTLQIKKSDSKKLKPEFFIARSPSLVINPEILWDSFDLYKRGSNIQFHYRLNFSKTTNLNKILKGVGYGMLIGGSLGALTGYALGDDEQGGLDEGTGMSALNNSIVGAAIGMIIGGIIGGVIAGLG